MSNPRLTPVPFGHTGMDISRLSLGTVKLGRSAGVKYPEPVVIPDDAAARALLATALDLGINLLDTAPAYGNSEIRLGELLHDQRQHWRICTKVGEHFDGRESSYDFSPEATRASVERSLQRLGVDHLDIVLIHSDGNDLDILNRQGTLQMLQSLKAEGKLLAAGMSHKTVAGGQAAIEQGADVLMATLNPEYQVELELIAAAGQAGVGVLIKKALSSGFGSAADLQFVAGQPGVGSIVVGTTNAAHLLDNVRAVATIG